MARVYANLTIIELEKQFVASRENVESLISLDRELSHRSRARAKSLHAEVIRRINELAKDDGITGQRGQPDLFS